MLSRGRPENSPNSLRPDRKEAGGAAPAYSLGTLIPKHFLHLAPEVAPEFEGQYAQQ
jgi:hypothetical protein